MLFRKVFKNHTKGIWKFTFSVETVVVESNLDQGYIMDSCINQALRFCGFCCSGRQLQNLALCKPSFEPNLINSQKNENLQLEKCKYITDKKIHKSIRSWLWANKEQIFTFFFIFFIFLPFLWVLRCLNSKIHKI